MLRPGRRPVEEVSETLDRVEPLLGLDLESLQDRDDVWWNGPSFCCHDRPTRLVQQGRVFVQNHVEPGESLAGLQPLDKGQPMISLTLLHSLLDHACLTGILKVYTLTAFLFGRLPCPQYSRA